MLQMARTQLFREKKGKNMKTEHRHELKTNDLAEWLANLPQWFRQNRNTIIYVAVVVVVVGGYYFWYNYQKNVVEVRKKTYFTHVLTQLSERKARILYAYSQGMDSSFQLLDLAKELSTLAQTTKNIKAAAVALIEQGQILRTELHYRLKSPDQNELKSQINQAKNAYKKTLNILAPNDEDKAKKLYPSLVAEAKFGLGLCEEELGNFDEAKKIYNEIAGSAELEITTAAAQAKLRLETMDGYEEKIAFKPAPRPVIKPETIPPLLLQPTTPDVNEQTEPTDLMTMIDTNWLEPK